ncbi:MAG: hypothetical protein ACE5J3_13735, partial [Methanosarcinales archaeon]
MGARIHGHVFIPLAGTPYKNAPSTKLNEDDKKFLDKLVSQGKLYGNWKEQEKIAESIIKYFQKQ